uniref:F-box like-protein n=1 Tax=Powellomyces hirtus TaxID=109895 RepID=A0A4P8NQB5_9FUNG|nr:F-box like-protein [Powellomyces hirtus]
MDSQLPQEVLAHIVQYLPSHDLLVLAVVARRWATAAIRALYRSLTIDSSTTLQKLQLALHSHLEPSFPSLPRPIPTDLFHLSLLSLNPNDNSEDALPSLDKTTLRAIWLLVGPSLRSLSAPASYLETESANIFHSLVHLTLTLRHRLQRSDFPRFSPSVHPGLFESLIVPRLETLTVSHPLMADNLVALLSSCPGLKSLSIHSWTDGSDMGFFRLVEPTYEYDSSESERMLNVARAMPLGLRSLDVTFHCFPGHAATALQIIAQTCRGLNSVSIHWVFDAEGDVSQDLGRELEDRVEEEWKDLMPEGLPLHLLAGSHLSALSVRGACLSGAVFQMITERSPKLQYLDLRSDGPPDTIPMPSGRYDRRDMYDLRWLPDQCPDLQHIAINMYHCIGYLSLLELPLRSVTLAGTGTRFHELLTVLEALTIPLQELRVWTGRLFIHNTGRGWGTSDGKRGRDPPDAMQAVIDAVNRTGARTLELQGIFAIRSDEQLLQIAQQCPRLHSLDTWDVIPDRDAKKRGDWTLAERKMGEWGVPFGLSGNEKKGRGRKTSQRFALYNLSALEKLRSGQHLTGQKQKSVCRKSF